MRSERNIGSAGTTNTFGWCPIHGATNRWSAVRQTSDIVIRHLRLFLTLRSWAANSMPEPSHSSGRKRHFRPSFETQNGRGADGEIAWPCIFGIYRVSKTILLRVNGRGRAAKMGQSNRVFGCFPARQHSHHLARLRVPVVWMDQPSLGEEVDRPDVVGRVEFQELLQTPGRCPGDAVVGHLHAM